MFLALLLALCAAPIRADGFQDLQVVQRMEDDTAQRIQSGIVDPILGANRGSAYVKLSFEVQSELDSSDRSGQGRARKARSKPISGSTALPGSEDDLFRGFGFSGSTVTFTFRSTATASVDVQEQESRQLRGIREEKRAVKMMVKMFQVLIIHDAQVPQTKIASVRKAIGEAYGHRLALHDISFLPVEFAPKSRSWW